MPDLQVIAHSALRISHGLLARPACLTFIKVHQLPGFERSLPVYTPLKALGREPHSPGSSTATSPIRLVPEQIGYSAQALKLPSPKTPATALLFVASAKPG